MNPITHEANVPPFITDFIEATKDFVWYSTIVNGGYDDLLENPEADKRAHEQDTADAIQDVLDQPLLKTKRMVTPRTWANTIGPEYKMELINIFKGNKDFSLYLLGEISENEYKDEYAKYLTAQVDNCQFLGNESGDIYLGTWNKGDKPYTVNVKDSLIDGQNVESKNRAISVASGSIVTLDKTEIKKKHADGWYGVAIGSYKDGSTVNITNHTRIYNNKGTSAAGVAAWSGGLVNIDETSKVYDNDASRCGDDLYVHDKDSTITFYKNSVVGEK